MPEMKNILLEDLVPFKDYPFRVIQDEAFEELKSSIEMDGVFNPLIVRPIESGQYEVISGHRRLEACKLAGIEAVPAIIHVLDRDAATIMMVDDKLTQRTELLPSEKAMAYKMKLDALKHQGKIGRDTYGQNVHKLSRDEISLVDSGRTVQRYVRLTNLEPELLEMVDEKRIAMGPAVEISYLTPEEQRDLIDTIDSEDQTPSISQAQRMRRMSEGGTLDMDAVFSVMTEEKKNQIEKLKIPVESIRKFFRPGTSYQQMEDTIIKALSFYQKHLIKQKNEKNR